MVADNRYSAVISNLDPLVLMQRVADQALELVPGADGMLVGIHDGRFITYLCGAGYLRSSVGTRTRLDTSIGGLSIRLSEVLRCDDTETDPRVDLEVCRRLGTRSTVCVPLSRFGHTFGVLAVGGSRPASFNDKDVADLSRMAELISIAVDIADDCRQLTAELERISRPRGRETPASDRRISDSADRFVMNVLDPTAAALALTRSRVEHVLTHPESLSMAYQPIVDLGSDQVTALEALARFAPLPSRPPDVWFAEAHRAGLGCELELLAIRRALADMDAVPADIAVTINVGPEAILTAELADLIEGCGHGRRIVVELTEHAVVEDYRSLADAIQTLRASGVRVAVDDTGAGFSSLAHILKLAPDFIKLDRELVTGIDLDPIRRALATALTVFASDTGALVIAEGIETEDELEVVRHLGVGCAQGFHLGRPRSLQAMTAGVGLDYLSGSQLGHSEEAHS